ncbi:hypothetical protein MKY04_09380 [Lysinibacillus telephonicus]|uniref:hypothetical protein n=1 Tax=Lysinibacillus telephonicus TaxID=1714840 RepID=UPI0031FD04E6
MKKCLKIDENKFLVQGEDIWIGDDEEVPAGYTDIDLPRDSEGNQLGFYRAKLNGSEWEEGLTQEEIDAIVNAPTEPTELEKLQQENEQLKASVIELTTYTAAQEERYNQAILELSQLIAGGNV